MIHDTISHILSFKTDYGYDQLSYLAQEDDNERLIKVDQSSDYFRLDGNLLLECQIACNNHQDCKSVRYGPDSCYLSTAKITRNSLQNVGTNPKYFTSYQTNGS